MFDELVYFSLHWCGCIYVCFLHLFYFHYSLCRSGSFRVTSLVSPVSPLHPSHPPTTTTTLPTTTRRSASSGRSRRQQRNNNLPTTPLPLPHSPMAGNFRCDNQPTHPRCLCLRWSALPCTTDKAKELNLNASLNPLCFSPLFFPNLSFQIPTFCPFLVLPSTCLSIGIVVFLLSL